MKTKNMRLAAWLLVLTLISACFVGGAFAKYVREAEAHDTAKVAKWGVGIEAAANSMFKTEYKGTGDGITVKSQADYNVVAPGTSGEMTAVKLSGTPEVACKVNVAGELALDGSWQDTAGKFYCPIKLTVGDTVVEQEADDTKETFLAKVAEALDFESDVYAVNTDLSTAQDDIPSVSWSWAYDGNDTADSNLGDIAAGTAAGTVPSLTLTYHVTVTQVD